MRVQVIGGTKTEQSSFSNGRISVTAFESCCLRLNEWIKQRYSAAEQNYPSNIQHPPSFSFHRLWRKWFDYGDNKCFTFFIQPLSVSVWAGAAGLSQFVGWKLLFAVAWEKNQYLPNIKSYSFISVVLFPKDHKKRALEFNGTRNRCGFIIFQEYFDVWPLGGTKHWLRQSDETVGQTCGN